MLNAYYNYCNIKDESFNELSRWYLQLDFRCEKEEHQLSRKYVQLSHKITAGLEAVPRHEDEVHHCMHRGLLLYLAHKLVIFLASLFPACV